MERRTTGKLIFLSVVPPTPVVGMRLLRKMMAGRLRAPVPGCRDLARNAGAFRARLSEL
jgi:hypothetical protein